MFIGYELNSQKLKAIKKAVTIIRDGFLNY